jgi:hypothetical protein
VTLLNSIHNTENLSQAIATATIVLAWSNSADSVCSYNIVNKYSIHHPTLFVFASRVLKYTLCLDSECHVRTTCYARLCVCSMCVLALAYRFGALMLTVSQSAYNSCSNSTWYVLLCTPFNNCCLRYTTSIALSISTMPCYDVQIICNVMHLLLLTTTAAFCSMSCSSTRVAAAVMCTE